MLNGLPNITKLKLDVVKPDDIKNAVEIVVNQTGGTLNYLINNAGRNHFMPILDENLDTVRSLFEVNFYGPLALTQAFAPLLIKAREWLCTLLRPLDTSTCLLWANVLISRTPRRPKENRTGSYAVFKISMELAAETLRLELAPFGVDVLEVVPRAVTV